MNALILPLAMLLDRIFGEPDWLWKPLSHPVVWFGKFIDFVDHKFNIEGRDEEERKTAGIGLVAVGSAALILFSILIIQLCYLLGPIGFVIEIFIVAVFIAHKSLVEHVEAVQFALRNEGEVAAREKLSRIVGRDTSQLSAPQICRAALESLAENFSDAVVAPVFWYLISGLPGLLIYKFINTADSMIGHRTEKYEDFGWAAAKIDDVMNFVPARITALLVALAHGLVAGLSFNKEDLALIWQRFKGVMGGTRKDAPFHRSPNAGWPEAAFAYALGLQFGGARTYAGEGSVDDITFNDEGQEEANEDDVERGIALANQTWFALIVMAFLLAVILK